ncbi:MAG: SH3 domain-containing protein, partial [Chloroflexi bacterium]|nr:SH3 domain-containing protein [Chloroflexota bacterium]
MRLRTIRWVGGILLLLALMMGGVLVASSAPGAQGDDALPPQVFETAPYPGEELLLDGAVTFYFDQPMNQATVAEAFSVSPSVAGELAWPDASTVVFTPQEPYARATEYTFTIGADAAATEGVTMVEAFELDLRTIGYLEVSEVLPADDSTAVDTEAVITVIFNRPVVPLVIAEDMGDLPQPLSFSPDIAGAGEWLNTSIYVYRPDGELRGGTNYTITVDAGLEDATGGILAEDYAWSFATLQPDVLEINPRDERDRVVLETPISVRFSQEMDPEATERAITLTALPSETREIDETPVAGTFEWDETFRRVTFQPDEMLELETNYQVFVDSDVALSATGAQLVASATSIFTTVPYPAIIDTSPEDGDQFASPYGGFTIYFNTPMDLESLEDKVIIEPEPWREFDTYFYDYRYSYTLSFDTEPTTEYTITILPGMEDRYGNTIDEGMVVNYVTDAYPPELTIQATGRVGVYSGHNPATRVFVTHRNISRLEMNLWEVSVPSLARLTGPNSYDAWREYVPRTDDMLRQWTVDVSSQQDERRYELLYISDTGMSGISNIQCLGAPEPQVTVGDVVIVTEEPDIALNIRQEPNLTANILTEVPPGETFQITGGPFCEGGYLWWRVRLDNDIEGWAAEGTLAGYFYEPLLSVPDDPNTPQDESPATTPDALEPGAYLLRVDSPETRAWDSRPRDHLLVVATDNITLKFSQDTALAWVTSLDTGEPVEGVRVIFYNEDFNPVGQAITDADGLAVAQIPHLSDLYTTMFATVDEGDHFAYGVSNWTTGIESWQFDISTSYDPEDFTVYLYTDRPIYRPDQPVYFRGILRDRNDVQYTVPPISEVPVVIYDDRGEIIFEEVLPVTPQGSFSGELMLSPDAPLGYYRIVAEVSSNNRSSFGLSFSVAEYRAPEFEVIVTPAEDEVAQGDEIEVLVDSRYFFGGPVSNATVTYSVLSRDYYFRYTGDEPGYWSFEDNNYDFFAPEYYGPYGEVVAEGEAQTDSQGMFIIRLDADLGELTESQTYTIEANVVDESDQLVAGRAQVIVHKGLNYVGLQPENYVGRAERENGVRIMVVDWDSEPVAGQEVEYEVVERRWFSVQEEDDFGRTVWTWEVEEVPLEGASGTFTTDDNGMGRIAFTPPAGGVYKAYATITDANGNTIRASTFLWVSGRNFVNWRQENSNRVQLITDKDEYNVGDTAEILIPSPWQGDSYALITVERGDILTTEVVHLETNSTIYELEILPEFAPNIFVSVMLVNGVDENNPTAEFRMGVAQLDVDTSRLVMDVEISSNIDVDAGEFAGPGDTVDYTIRVTDWEGNPVPNAEVGISLTDKAVLTIADPNSPDLLPFFYSERGLTVRTSVPLTISVDQATQVIIDTIKGGGGGYGEGGVFDVRQEFVDTPLWAPSVITDENGEATISVTLPDNLTTWKMDARAVTTGEDGPMLVGQGTDELLSAKPLLLRPGTPRFFIVNDQATVAAIINNNTNSDVEADVWLEGTGFELLNPDAIRQVVTIPAKGRARINWEISVLDVENIDLTFYVLSEDGEYSDASKPPLGQGEERLLPVYKYEVPETVGTGGTLYGPEASGRTESIVLPRRFNVTQGELTVRIDRSLAAATIDGLDWLRNYPYYCTEQVISRFLPNAVTVRALRDLGVENAELEANLDREVNFALQRLYSTQKSDGGWGWFSQDRSNPIVTAYAIIGLVEAENAGYSVDQGVKERAIGFVSDSLITIRAQDQTWRINRQSFLLYALAGAGEPNVAATVRLFDEREMMSLYAKAYLALTFHMIDPNDPRAMELINDLNNSIIVSATGAHWEEEYQDWWNWNTDTRTTALALMAMIEIDPDNQLIPNVIRWLMVARQGDYWETTQETAWAVMALTEWMVVTGELYPDYSFNVSLNGERQDLDDNTANPDNVQETEVLVIEVGDLLADQANRLAFSRTDGDGNMYYTAHLRAFLPVPEVEALNRGLIVNRRYSLLSDPDGTPIDTADVGEPVQVTVTIIAPNNLHYVVIEDPIPAGADAVNPNLNTTSQVGTQPNLNRTDPLSRGWGWWWFSNIEMRDEKVVMYATYLPRGTYEFTYVIYPSLAGAYNVIPTTGFEFYFPEVYGRGDGMLFTITGGTPSDGVIPGAEIEAVETEAAEGEADAEEMAEGEMAEEAEEMAEEAAESDEMAEDEGEEADAEAELEMEAEAEGEEMAEEAAEGEEIAEDEGEEADAEDQEELEADA